MTTLEDLKAHYARMNVRSLAPTGRLPIDVTNPGTSRPEAARGPSGLPSVDQTMSVSISSNSVRTSNGQEQRLDLAPLQGGVTVLEIPRLSTRPSNGQFQHRNYKPVDQGTRAGAAAHLPVNVDVSRQNFHVPPLDKTTELPPARDVRAGEKGPAAGIPKSITVR